MGYVKGQVVMKCLPFSYVINNENISKVCDFCLKTSQKSTAMKKVGVKSIKCRDVTAINNNVTELLFTTHPSGLFQIDVFVWHSILFMSMTIVKQNRVANKSINLEESTRMSSK